MESQGKCKNVDVSNVMSQHHAFRMNEINEKQGDDLNQTDQNHLNFNDNESGMNETDQKNYEKVFIVNDNDVNLNDEEVNKNETTHAHISSSESISHHHLESMIPTSRQNSKKEIISALHDSLGKSPRNLPKLSCTKRQAPASVS